MTNISGATVTMGASGKSYNLPYSTSHSVFPPMTYSGYYAQIPSGDRSAVSSNPTISDLTLTLTMDQYPNFVSNVKIGGSSTQNGASAITVSPNSDLTVTWENAT